MGRGRKGKGDGRRGRGERVGNRRKGSTWIFLFRAPSDFLVTPLFTRCCV